MKRDCVGKLSDLLAETATHARACVAASERVKAEFHGEPIAYPMPKEQPKKTASVPLSEKDFLAIESIMEAGNLVAEIMRELLGETFLSRVGIPTFRRFFFTPFDGLNGGNGVNVATVARLANAMQIVLQREGLTDATAEEFFSVCLGESSAQWLGSTMLLAAFSKALRDVGLLADRRNDERTTAIFYKHLGQKIKPKLLAKKRSSEGSEPHREKAKKIASDIAEIFRRGWRYAPESEG